ncbi:MAG TPA: NADPH-dependent FMN reductase [Candidatus Limnocylindria bacterium]|nr:NADPH-dependent FMN reductase [Candidatus Limnocylindria bacterium]
MTTINRPIRLLGIAGSLRAASFNRALLRAAVELAPSGVLITTFDELGALPLYDGDVEAAGDPIAVRAIRAAIDAADAILLVTPEYNDGTSAVLKNAIDWASRPPRRTLAGKLVAVMGASVTPGGARGGIESVKRSLRRAGSEVLDEQVGVASAADAFDAELRLTDPSIRAEVASLVASLVARASAGRDQAVAA